MLEEIGLLVKDNTKHNSALVYDDEGNKLDQFQVTRMTFFFESLTFIISS